MDLTCPCNNGQKQGKNANKSMKSCYRFPCFFRYWRIFYIIQSTCLNWNSYTLFSCKGISISYSIYSLNHKSSKHLVHYHIAATSYKRNFLNHVIQYLIKIAWNSGASVFIIWWLLLRVALNFYAGIET